DGFVLKKTESGDLVLDYDGHHDATPEPYAPKTEQTNRVCVPAYYEVAKNAHFKDQLPTREQLTEWLQDSPRQLEFGQDDNPLINVWIRFGSSGVERLLRALGSLSDSNLLSVLLRYLGRYHQWDHLLEDDHLFACIERMKSYDSVQRKML